MMCHAEDLRPGDVLSEGGNLVVSTTLHYDTVLVRVLQPDTSITVLPYSLRYRVSRRERES